MTRTIIVKDTLEPQITLTLNGSVVQRSKISGFGLDEVAKSQGKIANGSYVDARPRRRLAGNVHGQALGTFTVGFVASVVGVAWVLLVLGIR